MSESNRPRPAYKASPTDQVNYGARAEEVGFEPTTGLNPYTASNGVSVTSQLLPYCSGAWTRTRTGGLTGRWAAITRHRNE